MNTETTNRQSEAMAKGLTCPKCGCRHLELVKISHATGYIRRRKSCRHCGHRVTTSERIVGRYFEQSC